MTLQTAIRTTLLTLVAALALGVSAQERELALKPRYVQGQYTEVDEVTGDTLYHVVFMPLTVYPELKFKNKKDEDFYWRTVRDVKKALPYAKLICRTLTETYELAIIPI